MADGRTDAGLAGDLARGSPGPPPERWARLLEALGSPDASRQYDAFLGLCEARQDETVRSVAARLDSLPESVRPYVVRYLGRVGTREAERQLLALIRRREEPYRRLAFHALGGLATRQRVEALLELLAGTDPEEVAFAIRGLGRSRRERAVMPLLARYPALEPPLRVEVLRALERIRDPRGLEVGRAALRDPDPEVVGKGLRLLRHLGGRADVGRVVRLLGHDHPGVRRRACWCLGRLRSGRSHRALVRALGGDPEPAVRTEAARALGAYPVARTARALLAAAARDRSAQPRRIAGFTLAALAGRPVDACLRRALRGADDTLRVAAAEQAGLRGLREAAPTLVALVQESSSPLRLRVSAAEALGRLGAQEAMEALGVALGGEAPLAYAAAQSLTELAASRGPDALLPFLAPAGARGRAADVSQVFALHLVKVARVRPLSAEVLGAVRGWLASPVINDRYLAARILLRAGSAADLEALGRVATGDTDPDVRLAAHGAARAVALRDGAALAERLAAGELPAGRLTWRWLRRLPLEGVEVGGLVESLFLGTRRWGAPEVLRLTCVLAYWFRRYPELVLDVGAGREMRAGHLALLLKALSRAAERRALGPREQRWVLGHLDHPSPLVRRAASSAARHVSPEEGLKTMVAAAHGEKDEAARLMTRRLVTQWMRSPEGRLPPVRKATS
ncbi:MAG: HEAT repeat domain-containing protein [Planctomycetes bacterium]|nr:HEAT repeat domain-containing protein [Planctomycetota bacterium]